MAEKRVRSPRYPIYGLKMAIERLETFYDKEGKATVPRDIAIKAWGYTAVSGSALQNIATLIQYSLLDRIGGKNVKISELGLNIVCPRTSVEKEEAIREAGLNPPIFKELLEQYGADIPSDETLKAYLLRRTPTSYGENAADTLIKAYRETMAFTEAHTKEDTEHGKGLMEIQPMDKVLSKTSKSTNIQPWTFPIGGQTISIVFPLKNPTRKDLEILKQYLDLSAHSLEEPSEG